MNSTWQRVIGIVGGLGPHAHIELERRLLAAVENPSCDQEYPEWIVSSISHTPDRTAALLHGGASPVPSLVRAVEGLSSGADFAVIACMTAHAFLDEVRPQVRLPLLDLVALTLAEAARRYGQKARVGILATTGSLVSGVYSRACQGEAAGLDLVSPLDLPDGERLQEELVMRPIYGRLKDGRRLPGGIKSGGDKDPETGAPHRETFTEAVRRLGAAGASCVVTGCTEIPLMLGRDPIEGIPLLDPIDLGAQAAVRIARGELPLP
ncbi:MAG TPA: amino acid racemase [Thermoanaerobaculia bacterium]|nr:amino acid racemase [Thermoanaerobaculia bacterium]